VEALRSERAIEGFGPLLYGSIVHLIHSRNRIIISAAETLRTPKDKGQLVNPWDDHRRQNMRRRISEFYNDRKYFSPVFATLCAFAALAVVLVAFRFGTRQLAQAPAYTVETLDDASAFEWYHGIAIRLSGESRLVFQERDESDATEFEVEDFIRRAQSTSRGGIGSVPVLLLISGDTPAGDLVATIDELKVLGFRSFSVVTDGDAAVP
jgi:hypothetical protein